MPRIIAGMGLLLLTFAPDLRAQRNFILVIGGEEVPLSEYTYYYRKEPERSPEDFLRSFVDYKLKVRYARDIGLDTLPDFLMQLSYYRGKFLESSLNTDTDEEELHRLYEQGRQRLHSDDKVRVAHISRYLPQHADRRNEAATRELMDSIYAALQDGADFSLLASRYSDDKETRDNGGMLPWMPIYDYLQEWVDRLATLEKEEVSVPFYSPLGIHLIKWTDRKTSITYEEQRESLKKYRERTALSTFANPPDSIELRLHELADGLLTTYINRKWMKENTFSEKNLETYFHQHRSDYTWDLPHYRGAVIHCKDKQTASAVKRYLKKKPLLEWEEAVKQLTGNAEGTIARIETGLFKIGENKYIDKLVFKCGLFPPDATLPFLFVKGKKLKKGPENYRDVRDDVLKDYLAEKENVWMESLRQKYRVKINETYLEVR